ncbi:hypothetical protein [Sinomonas atrocyanea]|uniref:hypothetical protein n=1 Tax=Sinomonas atrocyanea TaxID=37927 RepID=UPI003D992344
MHSLTAFQAYDLREYDRAADHAAAAATSLEARKHELWWDMACLRAECLLKLRRFSEAALIAEELLKELPAALELLRARAHALLAQCERGRGHLAEAVHHAREAVHAAAGLHSQSAMLLDSLAALIAVLTEAGELDEAWEHCHVLARLAETEPTSLTQGTAHAAIGNVAFLRGDHHEGAARHHRAAEILSATCDLAHWAEFNKSAAAARIRGGSIGPETARMLSRAELAYSATGRTKEDDLELALLRTLLLNEALEASGQAEDGSPRARIVERSRATSPQDPEGPD